MKQVGYRLKTNLKEKDVNNRLKYSPEIIEFHLNEEDLEDTYLLEERIKKCQALGIKVYMHHPWSYNGKLLDIMSDDAEILDYYWTSSRILNEICRKYNIRCVVHAHYEGTESSKYVELSFAKKMMEAIKKIVDFAEDRFLWEDTIEGMFSYQSPYLIEEIIKPLQLQTNIDISHAFISLKGDNEKLKKILDEATPFAKYFHVVDSKGLNHDSLKLGEGYIDWKMVKPYIIHHDFIFEIGLTDYSDCSPMVESCDYFNQIKI